MVLRVGDRVGEWIVDGPLGEGGMGTVYRVHSALSARVDAAMKVLKPTSDDGARPRFVREAEALAALRHPAIVRVMGFSEDPHRGILYLVMELAEGPTLRQRMDGGPMALAEALATFVPLASALHHAHAAGVVHRDVKPSNVVLTADGPLLVDFGIATSQELETLTSTGHMGTLSYMPPEVFRGDADADARSADVYALGLVLHEALTATRVFPGEGPPAAMAAAIAVRKLKQEPLDPGPGVPDRLRDLVRTSTSPTAAERPTMTAFHDRLVGLVERRGSRAPVDAAGRLASAAPPVVHDPTVRVPEPTPVPRGVPGHRVLPIALALFAVMGLLMIWPIARLVRERDEKIARPTPRGAVRRASPAPTTTPPVTAPARVVPSPSPAPSAAPSAVYDGPQLAGAWRLENVVEDANHAPFVGLRLGYELDLMQEGARVRGAGRKVSENGVGLPSAARTPIGVDGRIEDGRLRLRFTERGVERSTRGSFDWRIDRDGNLLEGRFTSEAAGSAGRSTATRRD